MVLIKAALQTMVSTGLVVEKDGVIQAWRLLSRMLSYIQVVAQQVSSA